jgi:hypothetical protein
MSDRSQNPDHAVEDRSVAEYAQPAQQQASTASNETLSEAVKADKLVPDDRSTTNYVDPPHRDT